MSDVIEIVALHRLKQETAWACPWIDYVNHRTIKVTMHNFDEPVGKIDDVMRDYGYRLVSVVHVKHDGCLESGREFWYQKEG